MNKKINAYIYDACVSASAVVDTQRAKSKRERNMRMDVSASADAHVDTRLYAMCACTSWDTFLEASLCMILGGFLCVTKKGCIVRWKIWILSIQIWIESYVLYGCWTYPVFVICKTIAYMYVIVTIKKTYNSRGMSVVACTDLWGKELHRQVGMGIGGDIREPMWCNGSTLARNARDVGLIPVLSTIFPIFITPTTVSFMHTLKKDLSRPIHRGKLFKAILSTFGSLMVWPQWI